jgi:hypothetical protein
MSEIEPIVKQLKGTFDGGAWHGPSFTAVLEGVENTQARTRPIEGRHTIWEIVNHTRYWADLVKKAVLGEEMYDPKWIEDWTLMGEGEAAWEESKEKLKETMRGLIEAINGLARARLYGLTRIIASSTRNETEP